MSSILDALKKLETESSNPSGTGAGSQPAGEAKIADPWIKNIRHRHPMVLILSGLALLLIFYAVFGPVWFPRPPSKPVASSVQVYPIPPQKASVSLNQTTQNNLPSTKVSNANDIPTAKEHLPIVSKTSTEATPTVALETLSKKPQPANLKATVFEPVPMASLDKTETNKPQSTKIVARKPPASQSARPPLTREPKTGVIPSPLETQNPTPGAPKNVVKPYRGDPPIKLQAIAWSENPTQRLAVINDTVAKEGQWIGDIWVERIHPDKIIIRKGAQRWELEFRR